MGMIRAASAILLLALLPWAAAPAATPPPEQEEEEPRPPGIPEHLKSLGYVSWDPDADPAHLGITRHDRSRTAPGYNFFTNDVREVYLMDLEGRLLHTWKVPGHKTHCEYAELLPDGDVLVTCVGQAFVRLDWESNVVWELEEKVHHDLAILPDGRFLVPYNSLEKYKGRNVLFDGIATVSADGEVLDRWFSLDNIGKLKKLHEKLELEEPQEPPDYRPTKKFDYYHLNTIEVLPDTPLGERDKRFRAGNWMISLRNVNVIAILDRKTRKPVWHWGEKVLDLPHMPTMLENGNILVYDNGANRNNSRVLELDPVSGEILWQYEGDPPASFFSKWRGSNQRLWNGNTLICESEKGHVLEVTAEGETVWEYWNPERRGRMRKRIYRFMRLESSYVERILERFAGTD